MKVLFLTTKTPLPINDGHALRSFNLLKAAAGRHEVTLLSCVKSLEEHRHREELESLCAAVRLFEVPENRSSWQNATSATVNLCERRPYVVRKYDLPALRQEVRRLLAGQHFDLVHLDMLPLGVLLNDIAVPTLLDEHNVESALLKRRADAEENPLFRHYLRVQYQRLKVFEAATAAAVSHVITCSTEDQALLERMAPRQRFTVVPNGVDTARYLRSGSTPEDATRLVFVGGMNWFPNRDALCWLDAEVMPLLGAPFHVDVVGKPAPAVSLRHERQITLHGFVDDTRPHLERAAVVVVPIRIGGGTRLKVLEAMSMGKAIVSTAVGVEGIRVEDGRHVLIADSPREFSACVHRLATDHELRRRLGDAARNLAVSSYDWCSVGQRLLQSYQCAVEAPRSEAACCISPF